MKRLGCVGGGIELLLLLCVVVCIAVSVVYAVV